MKSPVLEEQIREFWSKVYSLLFEQGHSVGWLANEIGVKYNIIPNWRSKTRYPQPEYLVPIANALNQSVEFLITGKSIFPYSVRIRKITEKLNRLPLENLNAIETMVMALPDEPEGRQKTGT